MEVLLICVLIVIMLFALIAVMPGWVFLAVAAFVLWRHRHEVARWVRNLFGK